MTTRRDYVTRNNQDWRTSLQINVSGVPLDISDAVFAMQIRRLSSSPLIDLEATTTNGRLRVLPDQIGRLAIEIPVQSVVHMNGLYSYDIVMQRAGQIYTIQSGSIDVIDGTTESLNDGTA